MNDIDVHVTVKKDVYALVEYSSSFLATEMSVSSQGQPCQMISVRICMICGFRGFGVAHPINYFERARKLSEARNTQRAAECRKRCRRATRASKASGELCGSGLSSHRDRKLVAPMRMNLETLFRGRAFESTARPRSRSRSASPPQPERIYPLYVVR